MVPVFALAIAFAAAACGESDTVEEGTELTPADTAMTTPPPAPDMGMDTMSMEADTGMMMGDTTAM